MSSDASIADGDLSSAGHQSHSSGEFVEAPAPADDADLPADDGNDQPEDAARGYRDVRVWWPQSYSHSLSLYASHNKFASPVEMEGSAEKGFSAVVRAPIGQDLVYRFEVDGEMQASDEAATMTLNGDDYNFVAVEAEGEEESAADAASATPASPPQNHRRQSSKLVSVTCMHTKQKRGIALASMNMRKYDCHKLSSCIEMNCSRSNCPD